MKVSNRMKVFALVSASALSVQVMSNPTAAHGEAHGQTVTEQPIEQSCSNTTNMKRPCRRGRKPTIKRHLS